MTAIPARQHVHPGQGRLMPVPVEEHSRLKASYPPVVVWPRILHCLDRAEGPLRASQVGARVGIPGWYALELLEGLRDDLGQVAGDDTTGWTAVGGIEIEVNHE